MDEYQSAYAGEEIDAAVEAVQKIPGFIPVNGWSENHYYMITNGVSVDVTSPSQTTSNVRYLVATCAEGDVFTITATGGNSSRAWAFADTNGTILTRAASGAVVTDLAVTAPANAAFLIVNDTTLEGSVTSGLSPAGVVALLPSMLRYMQAISSSQDWNTITEPGIYTFSGTAQATALHRPVTGGGILIPLPFAGPEKNAQICVAMATGYIYSRARANASSEWTAWNRALADADLPQILSVKFRLTSTDNLNTLLTNGIYRYAGSNPPANAPTNIGGLVLIIAYAGDPTFAAQVYLGKNSVYLIRYTDDSGSTWSTWLPLGGGASSSVMSELPVLALTGDTSSMSKENAVTLNYSLFGQTGTCTCKWQGSSSQRYPKKNYTVKFDTAMDGWYQWATYVNTRRAANGNISTIDTTSRWGNQKKFCFKANWVDPSAARNIVSARLWGQIVAGRVAAGTVDDGRADAPNYGAIDGFPVEIRINGVSTGLYTMNIPKDAWTFAMGEGAAEYIVAGEDNASQACRWKATAALDGTDYELEYAPDGVETSTVAASLNAAISAAINAGSNWETALAPYLDVDSVFDYFIFTCCIANNDALARNILYGSYDGVKWFMSAYDMDTTFGNDPYGTAYFPVAGERTNFAAAAAMHRLAYLMVTYSAAKLKTRYQALRAGVLSDGNVWHEFASFINYIPERDYAIDRDIWPNTPGTSTANLAQFMEYYRMHCAYLDAEVAAL